MNFIEKFKWDISTGHISKSSASDLLGISRPTLYKRLVKGDWSKGEIEILKNKY